MFTDHYIVMSAVTDCCLLDLYLHIHVHAGTLHQLSELRHTCYFVIKLQMFSKFPKREKNYDPRDGTMKFVDRADDLDPLSETFSETCLVKSENDA